MAEESSRGKSVIRLAVSAEGHTEVEFINKVLAKHLQQSCDTYAYPISLNGNVTVENIVCHMVLMLKSFDAVTSLVDFYGFAGKRNRTVDELAEAIRCGVAEKAGWQQKKVIPYMNLRPCCFPM